MDERVQAIAPLGACTQQTLTMADQGAQLAHKRWRHPYFWNKIRTEELCQDQDIMLRPEGTRS
jgi:hypothetical protein